MVRAISRCLLALALGLVVLPLAAREVYWTALEALSGPLTAQGRRLGLLAAFGLATGLALAGAAFWRWRSPGRLATVLAALRDGRGSWRTLGVAVALALAVVALGLWGGRRAWLVREDGPVEVAQVLVLLVAGGIVLRRAGRVAGTRLEQLALGFFAFGLLAVAGEEISWGQRLLGWETPTAWKQLNYQGETNLHNVVPPMAVESYNLVTVAFVLVGLALALWQADDGPWARRLRTLAPAPAWLPLVLAVGLCWALRLAGVVRSAEIEELAAYLWFLGWALTLRQRPAAAT